MDDALYVKACMKMMDLYCHFRGRWLIMGKEITNQIKDRYNEGNVMSHLRGEYSFGVYAGPYSTKFLTVDVDIDDPAVVRKVIDTIEEMGIPRDMIYVSFSGRKGYHVEIFFRDYVYNNVAMKFYWAMIDRAGLDPKKVEFRPTDGQAIKLPLGIHQKTGNRCWFVDRETLEPIESFDPLFSIEKVDQEYFNELVRRITKEYVSEAYEEISKQKETGARKKTKVCYDSLTVTRIGTRHNLQAKVAARARMDGLDYDEIVKAQMDWYAAQDKSKIASTYDEVMLDAERLADWAMKNVSVKNVIVKQEEHREASPIRIAKQAVPYILRAPTRTGRLVMFLLFIFSVKYEEVRMSIKTIAEFVGVTSAVVCNVISRMESEGLLEKRKTFNKYNKIAVLQGTNVYRVPGLKKFRSPDSKYLNADFYDITEYVTKDNLRDLYFRTLAAICKPEYLERHLTKPELVECERRVDACGDAGAVADAGGAEGILCIQ